ncbi:MAG: DNA cytosine methyltransferase [Subdoligranulum sp.]
MIRYISLFSGIGAFEKALDNLGIPYELLAYCEVDKYASKAYSLLHHVPESMNLGDITKVDEKALPTDIDLLTYGFPCQDISIAGNKRGFVNEDGTKTPEADCSLTHCVSSNIANRKWLLLRT